MSESLAAKTPVDTTPFVRYAGPGYGWYVARRTDRNGYLETIVTARPFTSRESAQAHADAARLWRVFEPRDGHRTRGAYWRERLAREEGRV